MLEWERCGDGIGCATATAPLDWERPGDGEIELALVRHVATGDQHRLAAREPRRPGRLGLRLRRDSLDFAVGQPLQERFDVVGFDPRGVGRSSAVACYDAARDGRLPLRHHARPSEAATSGSPRSSAAAADFGEACSENTGDLLAHVDTVSAARDLDLLRAILGDEQLNYLGYSYGTFLGATYADLYPDKVGRLVLDGAIDPSASDAEVTQAQAVGFEQALRAYLEDCLTGTTARSTGRSTTRWTRSAGCWHPSTRARCAAPTAAWSAPTRCSPRSSTRSTARTRGRTSATCSSRSCSARPTSRSRFADGYYGRSEDGTYLDNSTEAFRAVNCLDYTYQSDVAVMREKAAAIAEAAPIIGPYFGYGDLGCINWPYQGDRERGRSMPTGAAPILVVGTTGDPATPYDWAVALAEQLDSGVLVTYDGEGHTAYNKSNCLRERRRRVVPHRRHGARDRPDVLKWSTSPAKPANIDSRASRIAEARPDATPP